MSYKPTLIRMELTKKTQKTYIGKDVVKRQFVCTIDGNVKLIQPLWKIV